MAIQEQFEQAVADSKELTTRPGNETLLRLYSLYKQATEGDAQGSGPDNPFDFVAKAKHDAWTKLKGIAAEDAKNQYIALVESLK